MLLLEKDWDNPGGVINREWEYPDAPIKDFIDWLRGNNAWQDNPELFLRRVRKLNGVLMDLRNTGQARPHVPTAGATQTISIPASNTTVLVQADMTRTAVAGTTVPEDPALKAARIRQARIDGLAKARAAKQRKATP